MFDRARARNTKIWLVDGLNLLNYAGISHGMAVIESDRNSMNVPMIENVISVAEDEETRILARLSANLVLETARLDQQLTLAQASLVTERARLALLAQEFEGQLLTMKEGYVSDVAIQDAKEAALLADRSIEVRQEEVSFQSDRFNLEAREVDLQIDLEEIEQEQAAIDVTRAEIQVSQNQLDQTEEELKRQDVDIQLVRISSDISEAGVGLERALLAQDEAVLEKRRLTMEALEIVYRKNVETLSQHGYEIDFKDTNIEKIATDIELFIETYNLARVDIEEMSFKNDKQRFETRKAIAALRGKDIGLREDTLVAEERELRARIVEVGAQISEIDVPRKRLEMAEKRSQSEIDQLEKERDAIGRRELFTLDNIAKQGEILEAEISNINSQITRLGEVLTAEKAHQDFRKVLADLQAAEPVLVAESRKAISQEDSTTEQELVSGRSAAALVDADKGAEVNTQRREEAFHDYVASIGAAELYAKAVVTTNLIQSISSG